jgi:hypothetical protein
MSSVRVSRAAGLAGLLAPILILAGLYLSGMGSGVPGRDADAASWWDWARQREGPIELGAYVLLFPGLVLFLAMFAVLAGALPSHAASSRLAGYGAVSFFVLFAGGAALASTSASTHGFYAAFDDPGALTVFMGTTAGYHFQALGVWSLALTIISTAVALRAAAAISSRLLAVSIGLAILTAAANLVGFGIVFGLLWILGAGLALLRWAPRTTAAAG